MSNEEILGITFAGLFAALAGIFIIVLVVAVIVYIFMAIGLFGVAKRSERKDLAWLAWIPVANTFLMALLVENDVHQDLRGKFTLVYGIAFAVVVITGSFFPFSGFIIPAFIYYAFYFIARRYSENPTLHVVIGIITGSIGLAASLFMFRNREPIQVDVVEAE